jgi:adenylate cyclase
MGSARWLRSELALARTHLDEALALYESRPHHASDILIGFDVGITSLAWQACVLWLLGYPDQASRCLREALRAAQDSGHAPTLALTRGIAGMAFSLFGRDAAAAWQQANALRQLNEVALAFGPLADSLAGRSATEESRNESAVQQMRQGMAAFEELGTRLGRAAQLLLLAQRYAQADQVGAGLAVLDEALTWMGQTGVRMLEAEAYRLRGDLLLAGRSSAQGAFDRASTATAEACYRHAIAVARGQEARWWELRATVSLCRLLKERNASQDTDSSEAHQMLAEIYDRFTEGFDTPDLREARDLLTEIGCAAFA